MPIHDWTRVDDGIFHDFHLAWIGELMKALNNGFLPTDYYALAKPAAGSVSTSGLALQGADYVARRRTLVIHHVSGDRIVALLEIVSGGNKASNHAFRTFVAKVTGVLAHGYHLLLVDLHPPTPRDPHGIHAAIAEDLGGAAFTPPEGQPLTVASYEAASPGSNAYVDTLAVGDTLPDAALFLEPGGHVRVPLEATYREAYSGVPRRWRRVLEAPAT